MSEALINRVVEIMQRNRYARMKAISEAGPPERFDDETHNGPKRVDEAREIVAALTTATDAAVIEHMVKRFLMWKLPQPWNPDGGISYTRPNYHRSVKWEPVGTCDALGYTTYRTSETGHEREPCQFCGGDGYTLNPEAGEKTGDDFKRTGWNAGRVAGLRHAAAMAKERSDQWDRKALTEPDERYQENWRGRRRSLEVLAEELLALAIEAPCEPALSPPAPSMAEVRTTLNKAAEVLNAAIAEGIGHGDHGLYERTRDEARALLSRLDGGK